MRIFNRCFMHYCIILLICSIAVHLILLTQVQKYCFFETTTRNVSKKYVGFRTNSGCMGNQLYHLITGYGIAKTLNRTHYYSIRYNSMPPVIEHLRQLTKIFPRLHKTFIISPYDAEETIVRFGASCCDYINPLRLSNRNDDYLLLNMTFGQHPKYFEEYLPDVREILQFSDDIREEGSRLLKGWKISEYNFMCIHVRTTDFDRRNMSTNMKNSVNAARSIAKKNNISKFMIFGDNQEFMQKMSVMLTENGNSQEYKIAYVSDFTEAMDFYAASVLCNSFLITAANSTFGWWLAFFARNQNEVFYLNDKKLRQDDMPKREQFLKTWQEYNL